MKILRENKLRMPFGYNKYTEEGRKYWSEVLQREEAEKNTFFSNSNESKEITNIKDLTNHFASMNIVVQCSETQCSETTETINMVKNSTNDEYSSRLDAGEVLTVQKPVAKTRKQLATESAERIARQIVKESQNKTNKTESTIDTLIIWLDKYISQGADRNSVKHILSAIAC
jgi:trehalose/maltose hydrolase-like predicted phosphorylase